MEKLFIIAVIAMLLNSCSESFNVPLDEDSKAVPALISNINVKGTPGGAEITYSLPSDPNVHYVEAELKSLDGRIRNFKSSSYNNRIIVDGLPKVDSYEVLLYSVSKSERRSQPIKIVIEPLTPPYIDVVKTFQVAPDFGGINVKFDNPTNADLAVILEKYNEEKQQYEYVNTYYTKSKYGNHSFRGIEAINSKFILYIKDRWGHISDTVYSELEPLFETQLDKTKFKIITLQGDASIYTTEWNIAARFAWDGEWSSDFNNPYSNYYNLSTNSPNDGQPKHITIDLGITAKLSRFRLNHYYRFIDKAPRKFEIWGRDSDPPADGSWDGWTKMASYEQKKPSGLPGESYTPEDAEVWVNGDNVDFDYAHPPVRYIRFRCIENWIGHGNMAIKELTFYGSDKL